MNPDRQCLTLRRPDDWHLHLRDGAMLATVLPFTVERFGRVDIAYNNAGVGEGGNFLDPGNDSWERCLHLDPTAVIQAVRPEVQLRRSQDGGGVIIRTATLVGRLSTPTSPISAAA